MSGESVLVTCGSGFIGAHCILRLLAAGYRVRTTVRSLARETGGRATLKAGGAEPGQSLSFVAADLMSDAGWQEAVKGCDFVLHVASPFPLIAPKSEDELIIPAREGGLRVLRAARDAGVKRVVMTRARMGDDARRVPTRLVPNWILRLAALFDPAVAQTLPELGKVKRATNEKARRVLGWAPRSNEDAIAATAESLLRLGLLQKA